MRTTGVAGCGRRVRAATGVAVNVANGLATTVAMLVAVTVTTMIAVTLATERGPAGPPFASASRAAVTSAGSKATITSAASRVAVTSAGSDPFDGPSGLAFGGGDLWVTNETDSTVTEVRASNDGGSEGTVLRIIAAGADGLARPDAVTSRSGDLWIANRSGSVGGRGSVTELRSSDGSLVRRITGAQYLFDHPVAVKLDGTTLLVLDEGRPAEQPAAAGALTEIDAVTGQLIRTVSGADLHFDDPVALAVSGPDAWITDEDADAVTELDVATGALVRTILDPGIAGPDGIATGGGSVWVADNPTSALTQIDDATGVVVATWTDQDADYGFNNPAVVRVSGGDVYVATPYGSSPMVTRIPTGDPGAPSWYMCNTNGPYYFSELSAFAFSGGNLWVASRSGANWQGADAAQATSGSLTAMDATTGALLGTMP